MKTKLLVMALSLFLTMPCVLRAEEIVIQLMEVIQMEPLPGDGPLDDSNQSGTEPTRPTDFRASINGNSSVRSSHPYCRRFISRAIYCSIN